MRYKDREGNLKGENSFQDKLLKSLYGSTVGRVSEMSYSTLCIKTWRENFQTTLCRESCHPSFAKLNHIDYLLSEKKN